MSIRPTHRGGRRWRVGIAALSIATLAHADSHALIMWIGEYGSADANLPGIENDARNARRIAAAMDVPADHVTELKNRDLTLDGMSAAMRSLTARIRPDDRVLIYFSGHGTQVPSRGGSAKPCAEGLVAQDRQVYFDQALVDDLHALGAKAAQVVMLNDSCFSGGAATRQVALTPGRPAHVPKFLPPDAAATAVASHQCGTALNTATLPITRNIEVVSTAGAQLLYVAAAAADEVSFATPEGSPATQAWADCLATRDADVDHSGSISGEELRACAQARLDRDTTQHQTITLTGNGGLPMSFGAPGAAVAAPLAIDAAHALADLRAAADADYRVALQLTRPVLHIGRDPLEFTVTSNRGGFLYVLQAGSDGRTFDLLFPNRMDPDNHIAAGVQRLPHASWRMRSNGPEGVTHLLALVSSVPRDFSAGMDARGTFAEAPATAAATRNILLEATGAHAHPAGGAGRYGASELVQIHEVP